MAIVFFKRYRMQFDLRSAVFPELPLPEEFAVHPWEDRLVSSHAEVKFRSFRNELDANVFP